MSGGHFDYKQYIMTEIADRIEHEIEISGKEIPAKSRDSWDNRTHYYEYPPDIIEEFKKAVKLLRQAHIYSQRIDWLLSGDDGEDSFRKRLKEDLSSIS